MCFKIAKNDTMTKKIWSGVSVLYSQIYLITLLLIVIALKRKFWKTDQRKRMRLESKGTKDEKNVGIEKSF